MTDPSRMEAARRRKDERRAAAELAQDERRREAERAYEGSRVAVAIIMAERRAQRALNELLPSGLAQQAWASLYLQPSARSLRGFDGQKALKATSRPISPEGSQGFHFKLTSIARGDELKAALMSPSSVRRFRSTAQSHQRYVEREDALEMVPSQGIEAQAYIEDARKVERLVPSDEEPGVPIKSSFGSIPGDAEERAAFWKLVEANERDPNHTVWFDPAADVEITRAARILCEEMIELPADVRAKILRDEPAEFEVKTKIGLDLVELFVRAGQHDGFYVRSTALDDSSSVATSPLKIEPGRGGVIQQRIVAELPAELSPLQRQELALRFCEPFEEHELPFWAAIHAPTDDNDARNFHLHINIYDRPCARVKLEDGQQEWDFAYCIDEYDPKQRRTRPKWPLQRNKIREMGKAAGVEAERDRFAAAVNESFDWAGLSKRLDPRTYVEMGIDAPTRERLAAADYAKERKGQRTEAGDRLARHEWRRQRDEFVVAENTLYARFRSRIAELGQKASRSTTDYIAQRFAEVRDAHEHHVRDEIDRLAAIYVYERLMSRARLKAEDARDVCDRAALEVAAEIEAKAREDGKRIAFQRKVTDIVEADLESVVPFDIVDLDSASASDRSIEAVHAEVTSGNELTWSDSKRGAERTMETAAALPKPIMDEATKSASQRQQKRPQAEDAQLPSEPERPPLAAQSADKRLLNRPPTNDRPTHANIAAVRRRRVIVQRQMQQARNPLQKPTGIGRS